MTKFRYGLIILFLTGLLAFVAILALRFGSVDVPFPSIGAILEFHLFGSSESHAWSHAQDRIIWGFRLPRVAFAMLVGAGLSLSGAVLQAVTRNVLADPYLFGLSSGSSLGVVLILGLGVLGVSYLPIMAFFGGLLALVLVMAMAGQGGKSSERLVLAGVAVAFLLSAAVNFILYISDHNAARSVLFWMLGALGGARWQMLLTPTIVVAVSFVYLVLISRKLDALTMGEETAETLGINVRHLRFFCLLVATLVTATLVAYAGTIGFVGLVIPHICRSFVGGSHVKLLPVCLFVGAVFLVLVDTVSRACFAPMEIPIGIVTSAIGGLYFLYLLKVRESI